jgi:hypothetical protein
MAALIAALSAVALLLSGVIAGEPTILVGVAGSSVWLAMSLGLIWLRRENGMVALAIGTLLISVYAWFADIHAIDRVASLSVILSGVATVLFLDRHENRFLLAYPVVLIAVHLAWAGPTGEGFAEAMACCTGRCPVVSASPT